MSWIYEAIKFNVEETTIRDAFVSDYVDDVFFEVYEKDENNKEWINTKEFEILKKNFESACYYAMTETETFNEAITIMREENEEVENAINFIIKNFFVCEEK